MCNKDNGENVMEDISEVVSGFGIPVSDMYYERIRTGHINDTYKVYSGGTKYILQRVNTAVFKDPRKVMHNIDLTLRTLKSECEKRGKTGKKCLEYISVNDKNYFENNGFWRCCLYIENESVLPSRDSVNKAGRVLGEFHSCTENVDISMLYITIQEFHDIESRIGNLLEQNGLNILQRAFFTDILEIYREKKHCFSAERLVHNDTKWENMLIDPKTKLPEMLIDFDTVMPGYAAYDFGDSVRSSCISDGYKLDFEMLELFAKGYFSEYLKVNAEELAAALLFITSEIAARYIYDVLSGESYFSGMTNNQKLLKYERNIKSAHFILENLAEIEEIINNAKEKSV